MVVQAEKVVPGQSYMFGVQVMSLRIEKVVSAQQQIYVVAERRHTILFSCIKNCASSMSNANQMIYVQAVCTTCDSAAASFDWSLLEPMSMPSISRTSRLVLQPKITKDLNEYLLIEVKLVQNNVKGVAQMRLTINPKPAKGTCTINPTSGVEFTTEFLIDCDGFVNNELPSRYSLRQGDTLIATSSTKQIQTVLMGTSTELNVVVEDTLGNTQPFKLSVQISPNAELLNSLQKTYNFMKLTRQTIASNDFQKAWLMLYMLVNVYQTYATETALLSNQILDAMNSIELIAMHDSRMACQALRLMDNSTVTINGMYASKVSLIIRKVSQVMNYQLPIDSNVFGVVEENTKDLVGVINTIIEPFETIKMNSDFNVPIPVKYPFKEEYPDYDEFRPEILNTLAQMLTCTTNIYESTRLLSRIFSKTVQPEEGDVNITRGTVSFLSIARDRSSNDNIRLGGNDTVAEFTETNTRGNLGHISVSGAVFLTNPYWWYPEPTSIDTNVLMVFCDTDSPDIRIQSRGCSHNIMKTNIYTQIKPKPDRITHSMVADVDDMAIHQIAVPPHGLLFLSFTMTCPSLRIYLKINERPKFYELVKSPSRVSPPDNLLIRWTNVNTDGVTLFVGVAPDDPPNFVDSCDFTINTHIAICRNWHQDVWTTLDCELGENTTETRLHCVCQSNNMVFASQLFTAPNMLNLPRELLLALSENSLLLVFALFMLAVFVVAMFWAWCKDKEDAARNVVTYVHILKQNSPKHDYIITIATGLQKHASTSSDINLAIHGNNWSCADVILSTGLREEKFPRGSERSFLIQTEKPFGPIDSVTLSLVFVGRHPLWFCEWIRIRDVQLHEDWVFLVNRWFSFEKGLTHNTSLLDKEEFYRKKKLWRMRLRHSLVDRVPWYSILRPFPRSNFTRKQRLLVAFASLMVGMMTSLMFFGKSTKENVEDENGQYNKFAMSLRMLMIIGQSLAISFLLMFGLTWLFAWSRPKVVEESYRLMFR